MARSVTQAFYTHNAAPLESIKEMQPVTNEPKPEVCWSCGCGNFTLRMAKLWTILTRKEESYIIRKCKNGCGKDQPPLI